MTTALLFGLLIGLSLLGLPLVFAILGASVLTILSYRPEMPLAVVAQLFVNGMDSFLLLAIPFFFLAGELMNHGGITRRIVAFAMALVGHLRGGLAQVNIVSSMFFSGISGSAVADTAAVGSVMIPSMKAHGYSPAFAAAITQCSSVIGPIIPPSIPLIVYAVLAQQSVGALFLAGVVPGLAVGLCLMAATALIARRRGFPRETRSTWRDVRRTGVDAALALMTPVIVVGGILGGVMTATEAGAVACLYAALVGALWFRELRLRHVGRALVAAARGSATVMVIVGASALFAWVIADLKVARGVSAAIFAFSDHPLVVLLLINLFALALGLFLDPIAALVILTPILLPTAIAVGVDPVHFGVMIVLNLMIGLTTPPVGYLIYLSAGIAGARPEAVIRESLPFLGALLAALSVIALAPPVTLWLPSLLAAP